MKLRTLDALPPELVYHTLCLLDARDLIRLRLVSKRFRHMTYDRTIWETVYANAQVPRPPGPYPAQSVRFLERILVRSERLAESWTTQPLQVVASTQIRLHGSNLSRLRIIGGKWLATMLYRQIVFHDIETYSRRVVREDTGLVTAFDACSVTSAHGQLVYVIFSKYIPERHTSWTLLEFRVNDENGRLSQATMKLDIPHSAEQFFPPDPVGPLVGDKNRFLYIEGLHLVFDTWHRLFYEFPRLSSELRNQVVMNSRKVFLTDTHAIVVYSRLVSTNSHSTLALIQSFVFPADPRTTSDTIVLHLSHEGIVPEDLACLDLIRDSIIDSTTESTNLRFLLWQLKGRSLSFFCVDLTLPKSRPDCVSPLSIAVNNIFSAENWIFDFQIDMLPARPYYIEASKDGYVRGFIRGCVENDKHNDFCLVRYTVDASGDECIAQVGQAMRPQWIPNEEPPRFSMLLLDGIIGRYCHVQSGQDCQLPLHGFQVVDVAVLEIK